MDIVTIAIKRSRSLKVIKRNKKLEDFNLEKVTKAIFHALKEIRLDSTQEEAEVIATRVYENLVNSRVYQVSVETIQDLVELELMKIYPLVAKEYILYREARAKKWQEGWKLEGLQKDIYESKYRYKGESFLEFLERVAPGNRAIQKAILEKKFIPAGRILAGRRTGRKNSYANCYALPSPQDNLESIFNTAKEMARTYSYGGGVGLDISNLRPKGATVHNAAETTSGPISFMDLYSLTTEIIGMKGRRGALMIMMSSRHPDIYEFIKLKENLNKVLTANISVAVDSELIEAAKKNKDYLLVFEGKHETIKKKVSARHMLMSIAAAAWDNAEPGVLFWDRIQDYHLMSRVPDFEIVAPNPCGEQPLPAYGACSLASINLSEFILDPFTSYARVNKDGLAQMVKEAVVYMNEVLDEGCPLHPLEQQKETARLYRQIGLGTMGWGDALIKLGIRYGSEESLEIIDEISELIKINALDQSSELAKIDGPFPAYSEHIFESPFFKGLPIWLQDKIKVTGLRNSQLLTLAPTGSIGTLLNISTGLEPLFEISYIRRTISINKGQETEYRVFSKVVEELMEAKGIKKEEDLPDYVVTAHDLGVEERIAVQAAMQKHIDSAISSTMNMDESASVADVYNAIILAHEQGLKGITFFRNNSRRMGILSTENKEVPKELCPDCGGKLIQQGGCSECLDCGYSACSV